MPGDSRKRLIFKFASQLYLVRGNKGPAHFPEGSEPRLADSEERLLAKIVAMNTPDD